MTEPVTIGVGCNKWVKDSDTRMVSLHADYTTTTAGYMSLCENVNGSLGSEAANSRYVVPAGKKLIILQITTGSNIERFGFSTTVNDQNNGGNTGSNTCFKAGKSTANPNKVHDVYIEVPAGNYIHTSYQDTGGAAGYSLNLLCIETTV
jgi:hypothetical protein